MNAFTKYYILLISSLSIIPLGILSLFYLFSSDPIMVILVPIFLIPIWLFSINKMEKAEINNYNMEIKNKMQDDLKRLGISTQQDFSNVERNEN